KLYATPPAYYTRTRRPALRTSPAKWAARALVVAAATVEGGGLLDFRQLGSHHVAHGVLRIFALHPQLGDRAAARFRPMAAGLGVALAHQSAVFRGLGQDGVDLFLIVEQLDLFVCLELV